MGGGIANYVAELRSLAEHCNYGEALSEMLRDRLVRGVRDTERHPISSEFGESRAERERDGW